ncbi:MAG: hypothetical protein KDN05_10060 [Verrucomicrobiae bacterium]|nr:hypothetical protein [Verrucomicrobiae bacterium]
MKDWGFKSKQESLIGMWQLICAIAFLGFALFLKISGPERVFGTWNLRVLQPPYEDARGITSGVECSRSGGEPWISNPCDPWERRFNYPRTWLLLKHFGLNQSHSKGLAIAFAISFAFGVLLFPSSSLTILSGLVILTGIFSPAVMLAIKGGNNDLVVFGLLSLSVHFIISQRKTAPIASVTSVFCAFLLKFYPVVAASGFAVLPRKQLTIRLVSLAGMVAVYVLARRDEIQTVLEATPMAAISSYGRSVAVTRLAQISPQIEGLATALSWIGVALAVALFVSSFFRNQSLPALVESDRWTVCAFLTGSSVFCGTFLVGNNWDYRLMFLLFSFPCLVSFCQASEKRIKVVAALTLLASIASFWHLGIWNALKTVPYGSQASVAFDELCNWIAFIGLAYLMGIILSPLLQRPIPPPNCDRLHPDSGLQ